MPSETVIVPKIKGIPFAFRTPRAACSAKVLICILHGVTVPHVEAMPTCDF